MSHRLSGKLDFRGPDTSAAISMLCCTFHSLNSQLLEHSQPHWGVGVLIIYISNSQMRKLRLSWVRSHSKEEAELGRDPWLSDLHLDPSSCHVHSTSGFAKGGPAKFSGLPLLCGWGDEAQRGQQLLGVAEWGSGSARCSPASFRCRDRPHVPLCVAPWPELTHCLDLEGFRIPAPHHSTVPGLAIASPPEPPDPCP